jgi:tetratricopeptide (TPR) repeat protein
MLSKADNYSRRGGHSRAIVTYGECKKLFGTFPFTWVYPFRCHQFLYNYTYELYSMGHLDEARQTATECAQCANGYNLQLLIGDICQMQGDFETAITHCQNAAQMCPVRFAPLSGMLQTYRQTGDTIRADSIAQAILNKPVKIPSSDINEMRAEAEKWLRK